MIPGAKYAQPVPRTLFFAGLCVSPMAIFRHPLSLVLGSSVSVDRYSHLLMVVPVSRGFTYLERKTVFARVSYSLAGGLLYFGFIATSVVVSLRANAMEASNFISLSILLVAAGVVGAFVSCYGGVAF